jgi:hypothetical protein
MTNTCFMKFAILLLLASVVMAGSAQAAGLKNNEVEFSGNVESVVINGEGIGTLFVTVNTIELCVIVNSKTIIQDLSEELITMKDLSQLSPGGLRVNIQGKYSSSGILANRIRVVQNDDADDTFLVRGQITSIQGSGIDRTIFLLGVAILINEDTMVKRDGAEVPVSGLQIGTKVAAIGNIEDGVWTATQIHILSSGQKRGLLLFEGTVDSYNTGAGELQVVVNGPPGENLTKVLVTPETQIIGTLEAGVYILVIGTLNIDYSVTAKEIRVLPVLEMIPDERKLDVGEEATFTIKLRESREVDVQVNLSVDNPSILEFLELPAGAVVLPAGTQTADIKVKAVAKGTAIITATIDSTDETATARVKVEEDAEDDDGQPEEVQTYFSPDHIKLQPFDSREVVLHIHPPQSGDVALEFTDGEGALVVEPPLTLGNGSAKYKVKVRSIGLTGTYTITATLPESLGSATATLEVTVAGSKK